MRLKDEKIERLFPLPHSFFWKKKTKKYEQNISKSRERKEKEKTRNIKRNRS
jgi:hypothetical protein